MPANRYFHPNICSSAKRSFSILGLHKTYNYKVIILVCVDSRTQESGILKYSHPQQKCEGEQSLYVYREVREDDRYIYGEASEDARTAKNAFYYD